MQDLLYKYIILHKKAAVPGLGVFTLKRKPAQQKYLEKVFVAPTYSFGFTQMNESADKQLYSFISKEKNINEVEAVTLLNDFAFELKTKLREDKRAEVPGIGILKENNYKEYTLESITSLNKYFPDVAAERIAREEEEQPVIISQKAESLAEVEPQKTPDEQEEELPTQKKDDWWIFAIILALLAIAAITYYYMQNGGFR